MNNVKHWTEFSVREAQAFKRGEFQGMVMQALKDNDRRLRDLEGYNTNSRYISMIIAGFAGIASGILSAGIWRR